MSNTAETVIEIIRYQLGLPSTLQTPPETKFSDLGADSLDAVELVMEFEEEFDICISDEDAEKITTVGEAIKYVEERLGNACEVDSAGWEGPRPGGWMANDIERLRPGGGDDRKKGQVYIEWLKKHIDPVYLLKMTADLEKHAKGELQKVVVALGTKPLSKKQYKQRGTRNNGNSV